MPKRFERPPPENPSTMSSAMWHESRRIEIPDVTMSMTLDFMGAVLSFGSEGERYRPRIGYPYENAFVLVSPGLSHGGARGSVFQVRAAPFRPLADSAR